MIENYLSIYRERREDCRKCQGHGYYESDEARDEVYCEECRGRGYRIIQY